MRGALRAGAYIAVGIALALVVSWLVGMFPPLGWALVVVSTLLLARAVLGLFVHPSPRQVLTHLIVSLGMGLIVAVSLGVLLT